MLHATLDSQLVFDDFLTSESCFLKNVLATFCRSDNFKSFHTCLKAFALIRSATGRQTFFEKGKTIYCTYNL